MGGSTYSRDDYDARVTHRAATASPVFVHDAAIRSGAATAKVHADLSPRGVKCRESRDSDAHPVTVPVAVIFDTTGSMAEVPAILESKLSKLMGVFLEDKASGKKYLGEGYPAILVGAIDDYSAMHGDGALQVGQFESGIEIDNDLEKIWLTGRGGGTYEESYELALYFMARHSAHDHWEKRGRKGYLFLIGDEHPYEVVSRDQVKAIIGDSLEADLPLQSVLAEIRERYHVFFIIPNLTEHYNDLNLEKYWAELLGQQNCLKLQDPNKICELIATTVAITEEYIGIDDAMADGVIDESLKTALVPLAKAAGEVSKYSATGLPPVAGSSSGSDRL